MRNKEMTYVNHFPWSQTHNKYAINIDHYCHLYNSKILFVDPIPCFKTTLCSSNEQIKKHSEECVEKLFLLILIFPRYS